MTVVMVGEHVVAISIIKRELLSPARPFLFSKEDERTNVLAKEGIKVLSHNTKYTRWPPRPPHPARRGTLRSARALLFTVQTDIFPTAPLSSQLIPLGI